MSDFETPMMRDLSKIFTLVVIGLGIGIATVFILFFPFPITIYGNHCIVQTTGGIIEWVSRSLTTIC